MKKFAYLLILLCITISSIYSSGQKDSNKNNQPVEKKQPQKVSIDAKKLSQREPITEKIKDPALGFYVYDPFTLSYVDFELEDLNGNQVKLSSFKGKVIFLNFWATWCGPCRSEMPSMEKLYKALKDKGFVIVSINLQEDKKAVAKFMNDNKLTFPVLLDKTGKVGGIYGARSIPTSYIFDRMGFIVLGTAGAREWDEPVYMDILNALLKESD